MSEKCCILSRCLDLHTSGESVDLQVEQAAKVHNRIMQSHVFMFFLNLGAR
jgi:hypothetical protein